MYHFVKLNIAANAFARNFSYNDEQGRLTALKCTVHKCTIVHTQSGKFVN